MLQYLRESSVGIYKQKFKKKWKLFGFFSFWVGDYKNLWIVVETEIFEGINGQEILFFYLLKVEGSALDGPPFAP